MKDLPKDGNHECFTLNAISALTLAIVGVMYMFEEGPKSSSTIFTISLGIIYGVFALISFIKYRYPKPEKIKLKER